VRPRSLRIVVPAGSYVVSSDDADSPAAVPDPAPSNLSRPEVATHPA
jgi:hypothetical protein